MRKTVVAILSRQTWRGLDWTVARLYAASNLLKHPSLHGLVLVSIFTHFAAASVAGPQLNDCVVLHSAALVATVWRKLNFTPPP